MKMMLFTLEIIGEENNNYKIKVSNGTENSLVEFNPLKKELHL